MRKIWLAAAIVATTFAAAPALAACDERPTFTSQVDPSKVPALPRSTTTRPAIEAYRRALETFRADAIEGYNADLQTHVASLVDLDNNARALAAGGQCSIAQYAALRDHLDKEFARSGDAYLDRYWKALAEYRKQIAWCEMRTAQITGGGDLAEPGVS
jgi:hypothetical protein